MSFSHCSIVIYVQPFIQSLINFSSLLCVISSGLFFPNFFVISNRSLPRFLFLPCVLSFAHSFVIHDGQSLSHFFYRSLDHFFVLS